MKKFIAFIFTLLCAANVCAQSDDSAKVLIGRLSEKIRAMENYEVEFNVKSGDQTIKGYYAVSGEKYYISIGDAEVYCDGSARYEVNPQNKEVTVDAVDTKSHNILTNPTRAFDFIDGEFTFATVGVADGATTIKLTSTAENNNVQIWLGTQYGVFCNVLIFRLLVYMPAFLAMHAFGLSL